MDRLRDILDLECFLGNPSNKDTGYRDRNCSLNPSSLRGLDISGEVLETFEIDLKTGEIVYTSGMSYLKDS